MKKRISIPLAVAGALMMFSITGFAQTNYVTITNYVTATVSVTNFVTVTNFPVAAATVAKIGETNAAKKIIAPPKFPWESSAGVGFTLTRGNSETLLVTANIQTHRKTEKNEVSLGVEGAYGENYSVENVNSIHGFGQFNHLFNERFYGYLRADALHDGIAGLQYRITVGPGVGYYFLKETNTTFAGEFGSSFVNQRLGDVDDNYATLRFAERFEHKFKNYGARVWENAEILPQVDKFQNYLVNAEIGIEAAVTKKMSLKTSLQDNFASEPAAGRQKNDVRLVSGINYKF